MKTRSIGAKDAPRKKYSQADMEPRAIRKAIFFEALQHPLTIFPLALAVFGGWFSAVSSANWYFAKPLCFFSTVLALIGFVYNYFYRNQKLAQKYVNKIRVALEEEHQQEFDQLEEDLSRLHSDFRRVNFDAGIKQCRELWQAYTKLVEFLKGQRSDSANRYIVLAKDTLRQGMRILRSALEFYRILQTVEIERIQRQKAECESELAKLQRTPTKNSVLLAEIQTTETRLSGCNRNIQLFEERQVEMQNLMTESEKLENALQAAYLEVIDLVGNNAGVLERSSSAEQLTNAISAAKRVEERLRTSSSVILPGDEIYLTKPES